MRKTVLLGVVLFFIGSGVEAAPPEPGESVDVARWIHQLGARRHRDREAAVAMLIQQRSPKALALLRQAAASADLDTRRRAQEILIHVERLLDSERLLQPQTIRLEFKEVPIADALADFTRRTGIRVSIAQSDNAKLAKRTVTLDTGDVSYWEALSQLLAKAGVCEELPKVPPHHYYDDVEDFKWGRNRRIMWSYYRRNPVPATSDLVVIDSPKQRATFNAGALRIQAVPSLPLVGPPSPLATVTLGVDVEPRFRWSRLVSVRIDHAIDGRGQKLTQPSLFVGEMPEQLSQWDGLVVWEDMHPVSPSTLPQANVELRRGEKFCSTLRELRGTVSAEVETPPTPLVTVADILKAGGQSFPGADGSSVRVLEMTPDSDQYRLKIEVKLPPPPPMPQMPIWAIPQSVTPVGGSVNLNGAEAEQKGLALYDAQGQPFLLATGSFQQPAKTSDPLTYILYYQPRKEQGPPTKFVFSGRRTVVLDVPFVLKNVPVR